MPLNPLPFQPMLPSTAINSMQDQTSNALLSNAASLVPDSQAFIETILNKDLHSGVKEKVTSNLSNLASDYLEKYKRNPFYAFSKEGRQQAMQMQNVVNNPVLKNLELVKKKNDAEYDRVASKGLNSEYVFSDNGIYVFNNDTGEITTKSPERLAANERPLTIAEHYAAMDSTVTDSPVQYDITSLDDVTKNITEIFSKVKDNSWEREFSKLRDDSAIGGGITPITSTEKGKSNRKQLDAMMSYLTNNGLSKTTMKTMLSTYYRNNPDEFGKEGSVSRAEKWMFNQIENIRNGQSVEDYGVTSKALAGYDYSSGGPGGPRADSTPFNNMASGAWGFAKNNLRADREGYFGIDTNTPYVPIQDITYKDNVIKKSKDDLPVPNMRFMESKLPLMGDIDNIQLLASDKEIGVDESGNPIYTSGQGIPLNKSQIQFANIKADSKPASFVTRWVDRSGLAISPSTIQRLQEKDKTNTLTAEDKERYFSPSGKPIIQPGFNVKLVVPKEEDIFGIGSNVTDKEFNKTLQDAGYRSTPLHSSEYNKHSPENELNDNWYLNSDETYVVDIFIPSNDMTPAAYDKLQNVDSKAPKESTYIESKRLVSPEIDTNLSNSKKQKYNLTLQ
jgi:hypothetical protein